MTEAITPAPEAPAEVPQRNLVLRIVLIVAAAQLAIITVGLFLFGTLGLADAGGGCGGG